MQRNRGEINGQPTGELDPALHSIEKLGNIGMAGVERGVGVDHADDRSREGIFTVAESFDEDFS